VNRYTGPPMTLGAAAAARVRLIVWCRDCQHQIEPDPATIAERYGGTSFARIAFSGASRGEYGKRASSSVCLKCLLLSVGEGEGFVWSIILTHRVSSREPLKGEQARVA
jgi:hypothetical protein